MKTQLLMYHNGNKINKGGLFFSVSTKSIRNAVKRTAERAAEKTGREDYKKVSSHDLRRFFAHYLLTVRKE
ncbi:MAG: XerD/XerC family integrase [Candidatus Methanohalarchaeum thermophilum]|uniref:XerD/XerC family integrase n=1 Tax=Methanohalarchaeum thermophilum TaxID=1903181 RepID=A0A1Q6DVC9_METT1|nr:MAG: XerD/XerC family integrase [Candidatus Methanohalarchaeum thermophilum]